MAHNNIKGGTRLITSRHIAALVLVYLLLVFPNRISAFTPSFISYFPLEVLLLGLLLLIPGWLGRIVQMVCASLLAIGVLLKLADIATFQAFDRPINPVLDVRFLADGMNLLQGTLGTTGANLVAILLAMLVVGIVFLSYRLLKAGKTLLHTAPAYSAFGLLLGLCLWIGLALGGWHHAATPGYNLMAMHVRNMMASIADLKVFNNVVNIDPYAAVPDEALFDKLKGKDVLVVFIESYGRTVLDNPDYAQTLRAVLSASTAKLAASGWSARSAYLTSPTFGGLSWLAHGTLMSGLWINSQIRYDRLVSGTRPSLNRLFHRAGWRTVGVQPAHTMAWPQGDYFGYDRVYSANDLGYQGQTFNWITMPDQYTLSAFNALERKLGPRAPVMAEIALISSHAPWTPLPKLVGWEQIGDGRIFNQVAREGDDPDVVWKSAARIREQYRKAIEYVLSTVVSYAVHQNDKNLVILVLGDHQPAALVSGESASHDVLVHLLSQDASVMDAVQAWQWTDGMLPAPHAPVWPMDTVRDRLLAAFSSKLPPH